MSVPEHDAEESPLPDSELLDALAADYAAALRAGRTPEIDDYADAYPGLSTEIWELLPLIGAIEGWKIDRQAPTNVWPPPIERLSPLGEYRLLREIGRGGMGVVYEGEEINSGRRVAVKLLAQSSSDDRPPSAEPNREAVIAAQLRHPHIVPIYSSGVSDGHPYYAMQLVPGVNLGQVIRWLRQDAGGVSATQIADWFRRGKEGAQRGAGAAAPAAKLLRRNNWVQFAKIALQIADALRYAHQQGVLHRDIKPANILLDPQGCVWITDFGLAVSALQQVIGDDESLAGTMRYMAPEQFEGHVDVRSDIYSLGVTLHELCTLQPAFAATARKDLRKIIRRGQFAPPRQINRAIPRELERIILRAMAANPRRRYASAGELYNALWRFLKHESAASQPLWRRFSRWWRG